MALNKEVVAIEEEVKAGVLILRLSGRLDASTTPSIEKKVFEHINRGHNKLLLDFHELNYLSSAGVRMLLSVTKKLKGQGRIALCAVNDHVSDVLRMSGFDQLLDIESNREAALRKF